MAKISNSKFLEVLTLNNPHYRKGLFSVESEYTKAKDKILVRDKYGFCKVSPDNLLRKSSRPSIQSAVNKTDYCIQQFKEIHGDKYDYSQVEYINNKTKVKIICPEHGLFEQTPVNHLMKQGCRMCYNKIRGGWGVENWEEAANSSKNFDSFKVYIVRCWNDEEEFYKIGRTFTTISKRFYGFPYEYEEIILVEGAAEKMFTLEKTLHIKNKHNKYSPKKNFKGVHECFKNIADNSNG